MKERAGKADVRTWSGDGRARLASARTVVVKIGSVVLSRSAGGGGGGMGSGGVELDRGRVHDLARDIVAARGGGHGDDVSRQLIVVSSGAVAAGLAGLGLRERPTDLSMLQAAAAVGQPLLMAEWHAAFALRSVRCAQMLVTRTGFDRRDRYLNIRNCLGELLSRGVVPIANENDTVATEEITLGDNDLLAARLAVLAEADALLILSGVEGVRDADDRVRSELADAETLRALVRAGERSSLGSGGMASKADACAIANAGGCPVVIAGGRVEGVVRRVLAGEQIGTLIGGGVDGGMAGARRRWVGLSADPVGVIVVDDGAARALCERGASLLPMGCVRVRGEFGVGAVVSIEGPGGGELARGLVNHASHELARIIGRHSGEVPSVLGRNAHAEVVHRDNMVVLGEPGV